MIDEKKRKAGLLGGPISGKRKRERVLKEYYDNPNFCKQCGKMIEPIFTKAGGVNISDTKKQIFCNRSCSAKYNNPITKTIWTPHKCENPECNKITKNEHYCSRKCFGSKPRLLKIQRFLNGELKDGSVRDQSIRTFLIQKQGGCCAICKMYPVWNLAPLIFIVDHIDGDYENNSPENIRAVCPNCNSQTDTFSGRNKKITHTNKRPDSNPRRHKKV
jgi:hypothetical protein